MFYSLNENDVYSDINNKFEFININNQTGQLKNYQIFLRNYLNPNTPYKSLLLHHDTGTGKTLTSINIMLEFLNKTDIHIIVKNKLLINNYKQQIRQFYGNIKLDNVYFHTLLTFAKKRYISLKNSLIIIDEVHNIINNSLYEQFIKIKLKNPNIRIVLLTATPIFDNISEIFEISNLLNDKHNQLPIRNDLIKNKYIYEPKSYKNRPNFFLSGGNVLWITKLGENELLNKLKGKVSYLKVNDTDKNYPSIKYIGSTKYSDQSLVICPMSKIQEDLYIENIEKNTDTLFKMPIYISILGIKSFDRSFKLINADYNLYISKNGILEKSVLKNYSTKLYSLLENITELINQPGTIFIYSNFVNDSGVAIVKALLKENGFKYYFENKTLLQKTFISFEDNTNETSKKNILQVFNSPENKNGDIIKIFIGSPMTAEGINFKNIRQMHILDPHWNYSRVEQITGRAKRFKSHELLDKKYRNIKVYRYASVSNKAKYSIDLFKYELSFEKNWAIKTIENSIKKIAIDCHINKFNISPKYNNKQECNYDKCNYKCKYTNQSSSSKNIDYSTYNLMVHNKEEYNYIFDKLEKLFDKFGSLVLDDILLNFPEIKYKNNIYTVLNDILQNNIYLNNKQLIYSHKFYILS